MCTDEALAIETVIPVETAVVESAIEVPALDSVLKKSGINDLLKAKQQVEDLLTARIAQEYEAMKANAAAIAQATNTPIEKVLEILAPKPEKKARKLSVVSNEPKPERIKYQHPENKELTWTGRGKEPKWLKEARNDFDDQDLLVAA